MNSIRGIKKESPAGIKILLGIVISLELIFLANHSPIYSMGYLGLSMCPTFGEYGTMIVKDVEPNEKLEVGEIYVYETIAKSDYYSRKKGNKALTVHRLVYTENETSIFKGDNNIWSEEVNTSKIIRKVLFFINTVPCNESSINKNVEKFKN